MLTGFGSAKLPRGERVRILDCDAKPIWVNFRPLRHAELHASIVPEEIRRRPGYSGYTLGLKTAKTISDLCTAGHGHQAFFNEVFHLVEDVV